MVTANFVKLQACKPFFDTDRERIGIIFDCLYQDIKATPELGVVMAFEDLRTAEGGYFPKYGDIIKEVYGYRDVIMSTQDYFQQGGRHARP